MNNRWEELEKRASAAPTLREAMRLLEEASRVRRTMSIEGYWRTPARRDDNLANWGKPGEQRRHHS
ncbi:hypothetical protein [Sphingomonas sp. IC4-52]|uniref:hypothetical protein n=1 Tax=Sphingomonas sp. IC4-52 TaxID=2887202 RepID=UPI001D10DBDC|nr:hypothetical protein [Sphingomonas sp. IC4-52]MCC2981043.1 hypothetical protein [Sphingomonas sp. IC4-52]